MHPVAIVESIGAKLVSRFELKAFFGTFPINRKVLGESISLKLVVLAPLLGREVLESSKKERPKSTLLFVDKAKSLFINERGEKSLHEVFRIG